MESFKANANATSYALHLDLDSLVNMGIKIVAEGKLLMVRGGWHGGLAIGVSMVRRSLNWVRSFSEGRCPVMKMVAPRGSRVVQWGEMKVGYKEEALRRGFEEGSSPRLTMAPDFGVVGENKRLGF
ncbi:unnamed protein product [Sphenostylis stenocarpa]|uniref:Uncharacterized protein n=1 Tax=Sphenostylis stenocarpa TaxID=92480 RepID=A0AA86SVY1_9FABA|nr:unnamed protein product [Sphenostylis stenocarpa]